MRRTGKKGSQAVEIPVWLIVVLVAAIIIIFMQTKAAEKVRNFIPFFKTCDSVNGECFAVSDCSQLTDNAYLTNTAKCSDKNKICCIKDTTSPLYVPPPDDAKCSGKNPGDSCDVRKVCMKSVNGNLECEEKCVYCAHNPTDPQCQITASNRIGEEISEFNSNFGCGCTSQQCPSTTTDYTCVKGMCSSTNPSSNSYFCCNRPQS